MTDLDGHDPFPNATVRSALEDERFGDVYRVLLDEIEALREAGDKLAAAVEARWSGPGGCDCDCCSAAKEWYEVRWRAGGRS